MKCSPPSHKDCSLQQIFVVILPKSAFSCALHWAAKAPPVSFKNLGVLEVDKYNSVVNINFFLERSNPVRKPMNQLLCFANLFLETPSSINEIKKINKIIARIVNAVTQHISIITASAASAHQQQ